jgi:hypothetical protein
MNSSGLNAICLSDIHINHDRTGIDHTINALYQWLKEYRDRFDQADVFIDAGDFWHTLISVAHPKLDRILGFKKDLYTLCRDKGLPVLELEGTSSHDWGQSSVLHHIASNITGLDYHYVDTLSIYRHDTLGISFLFVPDNLESPPDKVQQDIAFLLKKKGIKQVDVSVMHGMFPHHLPDLEHVQRYDPEYFMSITRRFIVMGHIHQHSVFDTIVTVGSFERGCHGDENEKGGVFIEHKDNNLKVTHLKNNLSMMYHTVNLEGSVKLDTTVRRALKGYKPDRAHIRIKGPSRFFNYQEYTKVKKAYPFVRFTLDIEKEHLGTKPEIKKAVDATILTKKTLPDVIMSHMDKEQIPGKDGVLRLLKKTIRSIIEHSD